MQDDFFKIEPKEPYKMSQDEFLDKTKYVLGKISDAYSQSSQIRALREWEYPEESVCDKCNGCGVLLENVEGIHCFKDTKFGDCLVRIFDYEQFGIDLENHIMDVLDLLSVDELTIKQQYNGN